MKEMKKKLGDYITQRREKNTFDDLPICGVCREGLIPPKQQDADISLYNVFYKNDFIFNPARMELNSITLNTQHDKAICSSLYEIFYINDTSILLPEFLFVQLKTDNFIRFCEFQGQGSVREYCRFANISEYPVMVPDIKEQQKIVDTYNAITNRIRIKQKINENLEKQTQLMFDELFMNTKNDLIQLNEIVDINPERNLKKGLTYKSFEMASLPTKNAIPTSYELKEYNGGMKFKNGDTLMARITPCLENGKAAYMNLLDDNEIAFGSTEYIVLSAKKEIPSSFNYFLVRNEDFITYAVKHMNGSSGRQRVSGEDIGNYKLSKPRPEDLQNFDLLANRTLSIMREASMEINKLEQLKNFVVSQISKR